MTIRRDVSELLAARLAAGATIRDAARELGIGEKTAHRRLADPAFKARVAELRQEMTTRAVGRLADRMADAADVLGELLKSVNEGTRLKAAVALLDQGLKAVAIADVQSRLTAIEERLNHASTAAAPTETRNATD